MVIDEPWYHITTREDWHAGLSSNGDDLLVHLGTKEAAMRRLAHIEDDIPVNAKVYLYEVKLDARTEVADDMLGDGMMVQPATAREARSDESYAADGVTRYVNAFESIGSVSLIANPRSVSVSKVEEIDWLSD